MTTEEEQCAPAGSTWEQLARSVERLAGQLGALADDLPAGTPDKKDAKALRRAVGVMGQHLGTLKKTPGSGLPG